MSVLILHLSDMHIEADTDPIIQRFKAISSVLNSRLFSASAVYIVVSGDIAQDGLKAQYDIALRFFNAVAKEIKSQKMIYLWSLLSLPVITTAISRLINQFVTRY